MKKHKNIILSLLLISIVMVFSACDHVKSSEKKSQIKPTNTSKNIDISSITYTYGNKDSDTVFIFSQGGPDTSLHNDINKKDLSPINTDKYLISIVHQAQTLNPKIYENCEVTMDEAKEYNKKSVEYLYQTIQYYKNQNKKVYLIGKSFGTFVIQELIAEKGIDVADKFLLFVGRLDMDPEFWKGFNEGKLGYYKDGLNPTFRENELEDKVAIIAKSTSADPEVIKLSMLNAFKFSSALGRNRYTSKLDQYDLSNLTYVYGLKDASLGRLSDREISFLKSKNAKVISYDGGHSDTVTQKMVEALKIAFGIQ